MMAHKPISFDSADDRWMQVQADMLELLLEKESEIYPWEISKIEGDETDFIWNEWAEEEIELRANRFFSHLDNCFQATPISLSQKVVHLFPQGWLEVMTTKAKQATASGVALADKLVECVAELLPSWETEDLLVLARPLAYSMRDESISIESLVPRVNEAGCWTELSEIEKARLSLAVARYIIDDLS